LSLSLVFSSSPDGCYEGARQRLRRYEVTALIAGLGVGGIAIALAVQTSWGTCSPPYRSWWTSRLSSARPSMSMVKSAPWNALDSKPHASARETPSATLARIPDMIREVVFAQPNVRFDRAHLVRLANASLDLELVFFSLDPDYTVAMDLQQAVYLGMLRRFETEKVQLAYPTRVIIQRTETPNLTAN
jgi:hypothetical protein